MAPANILALIPASISHNLHLQPPVARAIKFAKENALPAAKYQLAACHVDDLTSSHKQGFHMGVRVPFAVPIRPRRRDQPVERAFDVPGDIRVRTFIDGDRCRGVRHLQVANPAADTGRSDRLLHLRRHIHKLRPAIGFHAQCLHLRPPRQRADSSMQQIRSAAQAFFSLVGAQHAAPRLARPHRRVIPTAARTASSPRGFCAENLLSAPPIQGNTNSLCYAGP